MKPFLLLRLVLGSMWNRYVTVFLTIFAIMLSVSLFLGIEKIRTGTKSSFTDTISQTDLIIGARSGSVQLLLYSIFHMGNPINNLSWESYKEIESRKDVSWMVPLSLGDSHRGYRVLGTTTDFFDRYKYRQDKSLHFQQGQVFDDLYDAVIGADVARDLGYKIDQEIVIAHGIVSFVKHKDQPFKVVGILEKTGTPVDRTVMISLQGIEAIHVDWQSGAYVPGKKTPIDVIRKMDLKPKAVTAALVGVKSKLRLFHVQRAVNEYRDEALQAVIPGVALHELWYIVGIAEKALFAVSFLVIVTTLIGMSATIFASLNERRREIAILRAMGAQPRTIFFMLIFEAGMLALLGALSAIIFTNVVLTLAQPFIDSMFGLWLPLEYVTITELYILLGVVFAGTLATLLPAWRAYKISLADGMMVKS